MDEITVEQALDVLRKAGWSVHSSGGRGYLSGDFLVHQYGEGQWYTAMYAKQPWCETGEKDRS